jgi:hypothetical protein
MSVVAEFFAAIIIWFFDVSLPEDDYCIPDPFLSFTLSPGFEKNWKPFLTSTPKSRNNLTFGVKTPVYKPKSHMVEYFKQSNVKLSPYVPYNGKKVRGKCLRL